MIKAVTMSESQFDQEKAKLRGMNEMEMKIDIPSQFSDEASIKKKIYESANVLQVPTVENDSMKFCGKTVANGCCLLMTLKIEKPASLTINCEKIVIGNMLAKEIKKAFEK